MDGLLDLPVELAARITPGSDGCWDWDRGYPDNGTGPLRAGQVLAAGQLVYAYRAVFELLIGPVPPGLEVDHRCRRPICVNPAHLEPVTHAENMRRMGEAVRSTCPNGHTLTERKAYCRGRRCMACHRARERARRARKVVT